MDLAFGDDPAFAAARATIALVLQQECLAEKDSEEIALAVAGANTNADEQERMCSQVNLGAVYQTDILQGWGAEQRRASVPKAPRERFDTLDPEVQARLMRQFGETLKRFPPATFNKSGVSSAMLAATFALSIERGKRRRGRPFSNGRVLAGEASWL